MVSLKLLNNPRGALAVPCTLMALVIAVAGFGIWGCLRSWRKQVEFQLTLDRCVGTRALELKSVLNTLTYSNIRMKAVRATASVGSLTPYTMAAIQSELGLEVALQEITRIRWLGKMAAAVAGNACDDIHARAIAFPSLAWNRLPPDSLGPQPFEWPDEDPVFDFTLITASRHHSSARVEGDPYGKQNWYAHWAGGLQSVGTSFH